MVRTKADAGHTRAAGAKAPRKNLPAPSNSSIFSAGGEKGKDNSGRNSYFPRETPQWQKPITSFFNQGQQQTKSKSDSTVQSSSKEPSAGNSQTDEDVAS